MSSPKSDPEASTKPVKRSRSNDDLLESESWDFSKMPPEGAPAEEVEAFLAEQGFPVTTKEEIEARNARDKEQWAAFREQVKQHGLFSITSFGELYPLSGLEHSRPEYIIQAKKKIHEYNETKGTDFEFTKFLKGVGIMYSRAAHLQFEAQDPVRGVDTFEMQASLAPPPPNPKPLE